MHFSCASKYATALSTLKDPIMKPIDQNTMIFYNRVSVFNEFGGLGFEDESIKMANALGNKQHMLLSNHGIITCLLYTSPSPRDRTRPRMPSSA